MWFLSSVYTHVVSRAVCVHPCVVPEQCAFRCVCGAGDGTQDLGMPGKRSTTDPHSWPVCSNLSL